MFDLKSKLRKTREGFVSPLRKVFQRHARLDPEDEEAIEELLYGSDIGVDACERIMGDLKARRDDTDHVAFLRREFLVLLDDDEGTSPPGPTMHPHALLVTGVNGVGKTTSVAKLSHYLKGQGKSVLLAAADTFRAAAQDQLGTWADRVGVEMIQHNGGWRSCRRRF